MFLHADDGSSTLVRSTTSSVWRGAWRYVDSRMEMAAGGSCCSHVSEETGLVALLHTPYCSSYMLPGTQVFVVVLVLGATPQSRAGRFRMA